MNVTRCLLTAAAISWAAPVQGQTTGNLLRNAALQDDWLTLIPENKNHHWCYSSELYHRRDFNPDGWTCKGSWRWHEADRPAGQRRLLLTGPAGEIVQRVNWVLIHDQRNLGNMADAGRFPSIVPQRSRFPQRMVRDLVLRVRLAGTEVPTGAGTIELAYCPPGTLTLSDPFGTSTPPTVLASAPLPSGTFVERTTEVRLDAAAWLRKVEEQATKDPKEAALIAKEGPVLPGTIQVAIRYHGKTGQVEIRHVELTEIGAIGPNLLANGGFEQPTGWGPPQKYRHFPGRLYYLFNTWHNGAFDNRGKVQHDALLPRAGRQSLQMIVPPGDEVSVASAPIVLQQTEPRLIEVRAWIKTDQLCMLHIDALTDQDERLDGFPFIHMAPHSIGSDDWRLIRQVFRPRGPVHSLRVLLCARGVNGYTLDDTGTQPQNNVVGTIWWDEIHVGEPESTPAELAARGVKVHEPANPAPQPHLVDLDLGERLLGGNVVRAVAFNPGPPQQLALVWEFSGPDGTTSRQRSAAQLVAAKQTATFSIPYEIKAPWPAAYTHLQGRLTLQDAAGKDLASSEIWLGGWTTAIDLDLGALYLRPEQKQFVRLNLGLADPLRRQVAALRLEVVRRGTGQVVSQVNHPVTPASFAQQRAKLPKALRDDLTGLLLYDLDVGLLPVQPFADPQRNWYVRVTALDTTGHAIAAVQSPPFCRLGPRPAQPPVQAVTIKKDLLYVNGAPWLPFGAIYGHVPVYAGPADPGPGHYLDLHNLPAWSIYDGFTAKTYTRRENDFNCLRYVAGSVTDRKVAAQKWQEDNLYVSSAFTNPHPAFSLDEACKQVGGKANFDDYLAFCRSAPMIVSTAPGIEEAFGLFHGATAAQLKGLEQLVDYVRRATGKPVMVSHGGYWNRFEFEKVPFYDIFDPETEPWYPAQLHTDLAPLVAGKDKVIWLRPQMYEDVPYERWRYHVYVEMMRGARGWQIAHGPGDASLFRGLHGELEFWKPILASQDPGPKITTPAGIESWSRRYQGKTYLIAATTRGLGLGKWRWHHDPNDRFPHSRLTVDRYLHLSETNSYGADQPVEQGPTIHGLHYLPQARTYPKGTVFQQWLKLDAQAAPKNLVVLVKQDGRWTQAAAWGDFDVGRWLGDAKRRLWFLRSFYRHATGFLGWGEDLLDQARPYLPAKVVPQGPLPPAGSWIELRVPLEALGITGMVDGVALAHEGGRVWWGDTRLVPPNDGPTATADVLCWDSEHLALRRPGGTKIEVAGLKKGARVRVLFEDRELVAEDGYFIDDFRGEDLYQRFGGGYGVGYGDGPVALHLYEIP
ncbi:MAG: hypothetical protein NZO58_05940 [Gemmataceae bacterium]|nr:hypothetical protein [Gemmataceae bacterium]